MKSSTEIRDRILSKRKPLTKKDREWADSCGPYIQTREGVRDSTPNTRPESIKMFGKRFRAFKNKHHNIIYIAGSVMWTLRCDDCLDQIFDEIFEGTINIEELGWNCMKSGT